jgi:anti-sigma B factor antagonist
MEINTVDYKGAKVVALAGEIDMYSSPVLRNKLLSLVKKRHAHLIIDLKDVTYIDSSGIATFVETLKGVLAYGGKLRLAGIPDRINRYSTSRNWTRSSIYT